MASALVGWELLYRLVEANLRGESDVIITIAHWFLIKEGGFRCLGIGDNVRPISLITRHRNNFFVFFSQFLYSEHWPKTNRALNYCRKTGMQMVHRMHCDTSTMENCTFCLEMSQTIH